MKKITFVLFLIFCINFGFCQTPYSNYLDMTSEWRYYGGGWNGFSGYTTHTTTYFDGSETINDIIYYKQYSKKIYTSTSFMGVPIIEETLYGPSYIREDAEGKFYYLDTDNGNIENPYFDNQLITASQIGDPFPYSGGGCNVESTETIYLGSTPLKKINGSIVSNHNGSVEGIGNIGSPCAMGIEYNGYINCYTKQGITLQLGTEDCDSFPVAERVNLSNPIILAENINVYPNPTSGKFNIKLNANLLYKTYELYDINGVLVRKGFCNTIEQEIDISNYSSGIYILKITGENLTECKKIIKH